MATNRPPPPAATEFLQAGQLDPAARSSLWQRLLAPNAELHFAGSVISGRDAVIRRLSEMPRSVQQKLEWQLLPGAAANQACFRAPFPPGAPGGLVALDYNFGWNQAGQLTLIAPTPHHATPQNLPPPLAPGAIAADFALPDTNGNPVALRDPNARAYLVAWTCNHCPWALGWHARLQDLLRDYAPLGLRMLQINANDPEVSPFDSPLSCQQRVQTGAFAGPYLRDQGQTIARAWGARHTPELFVLDAQLRVAYHGAPDASHADPSLAASYARAALDAVLAGEFPQLTHTPPIGCTIKWTLH